MRLKFVMRLTLCLVVILSLWILSLPLNLTDNLLAYLLVHLLVPEYRVVTLASIYAVPESAFKSYLALADLILEPVRARRMLLDQLTAKILLLKPMKERKLPLQVLFAHWWNSGLLLSLWLRRLVWLPMKHGYWGFLGWLIVNRVEVLCLRKHQTAVLLVVQLRVISIYWSVESSLFWHKRGWLEFLSQAYRALVVFF